jgi:hypothetical protein
MKRIVVNSLVLLVMGVLCSCEVPTDPYLDTEETFYSLCLRFEDADGHNLGDSLPVTYKEPVDQPLENAKYAKIETKTKKFDFGYIRCDGDPDPEFANYGLYMKRFDDGEWYVYNDYRTWMSKYSRDTLKYELKFPALFGDDDVHRMVSYWTVPKEKFQNKHYAICHYIELDGRELHVIQQGDLMDVKTPIAITNRVTITPDKSTRVTLETDSDIVY